VLDVTLLAAGQYWLFDQSTVILMGVVMVLLAAATLVSHLLQRQPESAVNIALVRSFNARVRAWWLMCAILVFAFLFPGTTVTVVLFGLLSFMALREFITLTPTRLGDHRALFWVFFAFTPAQYILVGMGSEWYGFYSILIPVYAFLFIPARVAIAGDYKRFLERVAKIQAGLLICVYALSHAPALLDLELVTTKVIDNCRVPWNGGNASLLFYFVLIVQLSDLLQYLWGHLIGKRVISPNINASKTWEGFAGGVACTMLVGAALWWATPFQPWESACMALVISVMGFAGSITMSAIKRDRGVQDYGTLVQGHAGVLDRIDSLCFAAPVFYHLTRHFFTLPISG